eukprot:gnl/TRDRNA2_/TRDRNA2_192771_c0_seq1.p1 gnl/TRDRNA2_/TRDRNA2_192771_c0~~gnl/TRDRNA2_/TRDRNA2_192771_c0_seq1.p1  ORF type:complete len:344 (+),score=60.64 gnl/TRDRNA2_/TRDRNA2_192771_c0_seq1:67-1032(+)
MGELAVLLPGQKRSGLCASMINDRIYIVGGHNGESPLRTLESFTPGRSISDRGEWTELPPMLARRAYPAAGVLDGKMFVMGGSSDGRTLNTVEVFDPESNQWAFWFTMPPMQTKRTMHASTSAGGRLFVCGGFDGLRDLTTVECYDPKTNSWSWKDKMNVGRSYLAAVQVRGGIYALGGQDRLAESGPRAHNMVEVFDLYSERWVPVEPLKTGRLGLAGACLVSEDGDEYVYATGGSDGDEVLSSVEVLNVQEGKWYDAPPMGCPRLGHVAMVVDNKLYVMGGFDGKGLVDHFECFDPKLGRWGPLLKLGAEPSVDMTGEQ